MNFGKSVRLCRVNRGLSQEELAEKIGMSVSYLSLIETNKRDPSLSTIERIAGALSLPISILAFLGAEPGELKGLPREVQEKLAATTLRLMNAQRR